MSKARKKYIITEDVQYLVDHWLRSRDMKVLGREFFETIRKGFAYALTTALSEEDAKLVILPRNDICSAMADMVGEAKDQLQCLAVTLDRVYSPEDVHLLDMTRLVCHNGETWVDLGKGTRPGVKLVREQVLEIAARVRGDGIILIDDGIWTKGTLDLVAKMFVEYGIYVRGMVVAIQILPDAQELEELTTPIWKMLEIPKAEILDWVCERDFFPGTPFSGKAIGRIHTQTGELVPEYGNVAASYLLGFGDTGWASLPEEKVVDFSIACLDLTIAIFTEIEKKNERSLTVRDLPRWPFRFYHHLDVNYLSLLREQRGKLENAKTRG